MEFDALVTHYQERLKSNKRNQNDNELIPWNWVCTNFINLLEKYASATEAILISELQELWDENPENWNETAGTRVTGLQAIGETQTGGILEVKVVSIRCIGGTHVWAVTVQDFTGAKMDHYLHPQFTELVAGPCPLLVPGRSLRIVGARASTMGSPPRPVLLPTQYLSVMLGTVAGVFDDHLIDPFETLPLAQLSQFRGTSGACVIAAKVMNIRGNNIYLCDSSVPPPNYVIFQLAQTHLQVLQLIRKGEVLRITPKIPDTFDMHPMAVIEYVPGSLLCVQSNSFGATTESVIDGPGIRSVHYAKTRIRIGDIHAGMSGVNILARVVSKGQNKPAGNLNRYPLVLCDVPSPGYTPQTLDVTVWDNSWMLRNLRPGMLIYAENLIAYLPKDSGQSTTSHNRNYYVVASTQQASRLRPISSLPGLLSASLFPLTPLSTVLPLTLSFTPYAHQPSTFVVRATILDYSIMGTENPVYTAHTPCMRVTHTGDEMSPQEMWKCAFCNVVSHADAKGEWEKVFVMQWKISDGSAECLANASPRVHELILQMRASAFAELDPVEQRARITAVFSSSYIFSLAIGIEGQKRTIRIDQLVTPNPIVETRKLVDVLATGSW